MAAPAAQEAAAKTAPVAKEAETAAQTEAPAAAELQAAETASSGTAAAAEESAPDAEKSGAVASSAIPNPMVPYDSYAAMVEELSFHPLYFPLSSGLELTDRYIIGGTTAELHYTSRYGQEEKRARFVVRTALWGNGMDAEVLSGVYGASWQMQQLGATQVQIAELASDSFVAYWTRGGYAFSVGADQLNRWDFVRQLRDNLIDLSEHYYD